jgi:hypothetical protein
MKCAKFDDFGAGRISAGEFAEHVRGCVEALLVAEKVAGHGAARREKRPSRRSIRTLFQWGHRWKVLVPAGAAAIVFLATATVLLLRISAPPSGILAHRALAKVELKEKEYTDAIDALEKLARPKIDAMDLQLVSLYRDRLAAIDAQIEKCRDALASNPANAHIRRYLLAALKDKQQTLAEVLGPENAMSQERRSS